jgi:hypothetical protein
LAKRQAVLVVTMGLPPPTAPTTPDEEDVDELPLPRWCIDDDEVDEE